MSNQVMISFLGLCTYFDDLRGLATNPPPDLPAHRMVLLNCTQRMLDRHGVSDIAIHSARLQLAADAVTGPLPPSLSDTSYVADLNTFGGATITVLNAIPNSPFVNNAGCLPSLSAFLDGGKRLGPPAPYAFFPDPEAVSCYVDFSVGVISGWSLKLVRGDMAVTQLIIETDGDPKLQIAPFDNTEPTVVTLRNDRLSAQGVHIAKVNIMNFAFGEGTHDDDRDFTLNYMLSPTSPKPWPTPFPPVSCPPTDATYNLPGSLAEEVGPACSNSNYP
jgi:hypothetical protein